MEILQRQRESTSHTLDTLIAIHRRTIAGIDGGKKFKRKTRDVTSEIRSRCHQEILQCQLVQRAIWQMGEGNLAAAADLCRRIQEHITNDN